MVFENAATHGKTKTQIRIRVTADEQAVTVFASDNGVFMGERDTGLTPQNSRFCPSHGDRRGLPSCG